MFKFHFKHSPFNLINLSYSFKSSVFQLFFSFFETYFKHISSNNQIFFSIVLLFIRTVTLQTTNSTFLISPLPLFFLSLFLLTITLIYKQLHKKLTQSIPILAKSISLNTQLFFFHLFSSPRFCIYIILYKFPKYLVSYG